MDYIDVPGYDPGMQERVPMDRVVLPQFVIERIRVREDFRIE